ncbi:MAG: hypothetical protein RLZZ175_2623 [Bacteroidota bacterium]
MSKKQESEFQLYTLPNGIKIVHKQVLHTKLAHCGLMLDVGSRDEEKHQYGIAHFWEHMAFKGTKTRKSIDIINSLETVGGELNAYTTKEKICFHATILEQFTERAVDILADITFNSTFPEKEIEKERGVILEEMAMYQDDPEDSIQDEFDEIIFANHSLGVNILGTEERVKAFQKQDFLDFIEENLDTNKIIFSSVSNWDFEKVIALATKYLGVIPSKSSKRNRSIFTINKPKIVERKRNITQAHCVMGRESFSIHHQDRVPFFMLNNILGGPGMNSRLNLALREKYGFVYGIDSGFTSYTDTGIFNIYFATEVKQLEKSVSLVKAELVKLQEKALTPLQLSNAKAQLKGQLAIAEENNNSFMLMMARSILDINKIDTMDVIFEQIDEVTSTKLQELANEIFDIDKFSFLKYIPK